MDRTLQDLLFGILDVVASHPRARHNKFNVIGRPYQPGDLERRLNARFNPDERDRAGQAWEQLRRAGLIRSTYTDIGNPEDWVEITDAGELAASRRFLDDLDQALATINAHLVEVRRGAWAALISGQPDSIRQSAHSGRELIDQTLKALAPDAVVRTAPGFVPDSSASSGITRRMRLRFILRDRHARVSESELRVLEAECACLEALDSRLTALAHARGAPALQDVRESLLTAESALRRIILKESPTRKQV